MPTRTPSRQLVLLALLTAALLVAAYWWASPYLAVRRMIDAAENGDADRFNAWIDYPRVRENLKVQLSAKVRGSSNDVPGESNPIAGLGRTLGLAMVDPVVDAIVRPELVMLALRQRVLTRPAAARTSRALAGPSLSPKAAPEEEKPRWTLQRESRNRVRLLPPEEARTASTALPQPAGLVLERRGFADWKLVELRLAFDS